MKRALALVLLTVASLYLCGVIPQPTFAGDKRIGALHLRATVPLTPAPTGACAGVFVHCVTLTWTAPTKHVDGTAITGTLTFDIFRATVVAGVAGPFTKLNASPLTTAAYEDDAVTAGTTYEYHVNATEGGNPATTSANSADSLPAVIPTSPALPPDAPVAIVH